MMFQITFVTLDIHGDDWLLGTAHIAKRSGGGNNDLANSVPVNGYVAVTWNMPAGHPVNVGIKIKGICH